MATTMYFDKKVKCQGGKEVLDIELGSSSYFEDSSIYLNVDGKNVIMDLETAKEFVDSVIRVGNYYGLTE